MSPSLPNTTSSNNGQVIDQIDAFIDGLNAPSTLVTNVPVVSAEDKLVVIPPSTDDEMKAFILKNAAELVENSVRSILTLQKLTISTGDPEMMGSLAGLIAASTGAIETVNKIHLQNKKAEAAKEIKKIEIEGKKEIQKIRNEGNLLLPPNNTNILIATREEIIANLTGKAKLVKIEDFYETTAIPLSA